MTRKYHMVLQSQMGPKEGTLTLNEDHGTVTGTLQILSHELPVSGGREADGRLHLVHEIMTAVSTYPCQTILQDTGAGLSGELQMDPSGAPWGSGRYRTKVMMSWSGEPIGETEAENS